MSTAVRPASLSCPTSGSTCRRRLPGSRSTAPTSTTSTISRGRSKSGSGRISRFSTGTCSRTRSGRSPTPPSCSRSSTASASTMPKGRPEVGLPLTNGHGGSLPRRRAGRTIAAADRPMHPPSRGGSAMAFDMSQVQRGARNRRTPYHEAAQRHDPKGYTVYNHMYFPIRFDSFESEFETLLHGVTLWDVAVERCLEISGPDGFAFAQLLTPRDLSKCAVGQAKYVLICDGDGGIINDPVLTRMDEHTFWFALASSDALLFARGLKNAYPDLHVTIRRPRRHPSRCR